MQLCTSEPQAAVMTIGPMVLPRARSEIEETPAETELLTETLVMAELKAVAAQSREQSIVLTWVFTPLLCNPKL